MTTLTQLIATQASKHATANNNFSAVAAAGAFGRRPEGISGLTWAYYGGIVRNASGALTAVSNGTISLSNATNYIELTPSGTVQANTSNWTAGYVPLYTVVASGGAITTETDYRHFVDFEQHCRLSKSVAGSSDTTLTAEEAAVGSHEYTGALTGNKSVIFPLRSALKWIYNNTTGDFTLTIKSSTGTGIVVPRGQRVALLCDATNWVLPYSLPKTQSIAYAASITPVVSDGERVVVGVLTGGITINAPTNPYAGAKLCLSFTQDGTGGRAITWNAVFKKAADGAGTANQVGATEFIYDGTNWVQLGGALAWYT